MPTKRIEPFERDVICELCGKTFKGRGIGNHRRTQHGVTVPQGRRAAGQRAYHARKEIEAAEAASIEVSTRANETKSRGQRSK